MLQYPCLENPMDRGAWRATVQGWQRSDSSEGNSHTSSGRAPAAQLRRSQPDLTQRSRLPAGKSTATHGPAHLPGAVDTLPPPRMLSSPRRAEFLSMTSFYSETAGATLFITGWYPLPSALGRTVLKV